MVKLLLENNSPLNATDADGSTALHHGMALLNRDCSLTDPKTIAIAEGHGDTALVLLKAGADIEKRDTDGRLPIELAPDTKVRHFILQSAELEGIDLT
jgi:26S proteasome non-ATPase regulatory subunit 10